MTIQWSGEDEPPPPRRGPVLPVETMAGVPFVLGEPLPSPRKPREVLVVAIIALLIIMAGLALWVFGPLPRVFPLMS
jgi:hypothetical protein